MATVCLFYSVQHRIPYLLYIFAGTKTYISLLGHRTKTMVYRIFYSCTIYHCQSWTCEMMTNIVIQQCCLIFLLYIMGLKNCQQQQVPKILVAIISVT